MAKMTQDDRRRLYPIWLGMMLARMPQGKGKQHPDWPKEVRPEFFQELGLEDLARAIKSGQMDQCMTALAAACPTMPVRNGKPWEAVRDSLLLGSLWEAVVGTAGDIHCDKHVTTAQLDKLVVAIEDYLTIRDPKPSQRR